MATDAIIIKNLSKRFSDGDFFALNKLDLRVKKGEIYGFLGSNGAGKSTTIRLLMGYIRPTSGSAEILGLDTVHDATKLKAHVGYVASDSALYPQLTGRQFLHYMADLQALPKPERLDELATLLEADLNKSLGSLSRGNKQKINILQAFMHNPEVLILDEPSSGLDPLMQEAFYKLVREAKAGGATVFMSSHILSEVQKLCDRVAIIRDGTLVSEQNIEELSASAQQTWRVHFSGRTPMGELRRAVGDDKVTPLPNGEVEIKTGADLRPIFAVLAKHKVTHLTTSELDLEEDFLHFYEDEQEAVDA